MTLSMQSLNQFSVKTITFAVAQGADFRIICQVSDILVRDLYLPFVTYTNPRNELNSLEPRL